MQYREFKQDTSKEDLQRVADISVAKEFDLHRQFSLSKEFLEALIGFQDQKFVRQCLRKANPNWVRAFDRRRRKEVR